MLSHFSSQKLCFLRLASFSVKKLELGQWFYGEKEIALKG